MTDCTCCAGTGEHDDGHECYVCDASGQRETQMEASNDGWTVCEGHHGRPDDGPENAKERYGPDFRHYRARLSTMRASAFAGNYTGVTHAGICLVAEDTGRIFLTKRAFDPTDAPDVAETWEFPGGGLKEGEEPYAGAVRETIEETGWGLPDDSKVVNGWRSDNGVYQGFVVTTAAEFPVDGWTKTSEVCDIGWFDREAWTQLDEVGALRPEMRDFNWDLVSGNEDTAMTASATDEPLDDADYASIFATPIPIHGVLAPEEKATGDKRGFAAGSMTRRPLRLPFRHQPSDLGQHTGAVVTGSVDRMMRKDNLIHYEGMLMPNANTDDLVGLMEFFDGRYGVSVDGDNGSFDAERTEADNVLWFDRVRASGLTAVDIPAFSEAYVAFGPHPDMPEDDATMAASMHESGDLIGARREVFKRGPGWVTDPVATNRIHDYWTKPGQPGYAKIAWGTPGDFRRAKALIGEKILKNSPEKARFLNQIIAQWHFDALGYWPGDLGKPGNAPDTKENRRRAAQHAHSAETFRDVSSGERKNLAEEGKALPDGSFPIANCDDLKNAIQSIGRAKDPVKAKAHIRKRKSDLGCGDVELPWASVMASTEGGFIDVVEELFDEAYAQDRIHEIGLREDGAIIYELTEAAVPEEIELDSEGSGWEAVLVSSATRALPPASYFTEHPDTGALVIEEPDENGFRRTYGFAGEWGVCHIGYDGRCVELPEEDGDFPTFHLGRTKVEGGDYLNTGVITYKVDHRDAKRILTESAEQQHFDNIAHAWAAVRLGVNEEGIWFSGVVLPSVPEEDIVLIEATGQVSGEWKYGALRALQAVNVPGFPVMRSSAEYDDDGNVIALVASAHHTWKCGESPAERMAALRQVDAEVRFDAMREIWDAQYARGE